MSEKFALYVPKKIIKVLKEKATASQFREFIIGLEDYDETGTIPVFDSEILNIVFEMTKTNLDFAKKKYEDIVEKRRAAGRLGGAPLGNQNARKTEQGVNSDNQGQPNQPNQANQADKSKEMRDKKVSSSRVDFTDKLTTTFSCFCINKQKAKELCVGINPSWLSGDFSYPEYITGVVEENYTDKPQDEKTKLFITIFTAEDRKKSYLQWKKEQMAEAAKKEARKKLEAAKNNLPRKCVFCGNKKLVAGHEVFKCVMCNAICVFSNGEWQWEK